MKHKPHIYFISILFSSLLVTLLFSFSSPGKVSGWLLLGKTLERNHDKQELSIKITETLKLKLPKYSERLRIWIPLPATNRYQRVENLHIKSPWRYSVGKDPDFGNEFLFTEAKSMPEELQEITLEYLIVRREQRGFDLDNSTKLSPDKLYLQERGLEVIDETVREISRTVTNGISDPIEKARALYNYVLTHVDYDTSVAGWGRGDVVYACNVGKGNCTDFHSLFISLARAVGIPARFRIGYPVPEEDAGKLVTPYHCWAEFFAEGNGWIPVDISEAWKHRSKVAYYFGNLDAHRILISTGREIRLSPEPPEGLAVNYFVRPYIDVDGWRHDDFEIERSFALSESSN